MIKVLLQLSWSKFWGRYFLMCPPYIERQQLFWKLYRCKTIQYVRLRGVECGSRFYCHKSIVNACAARPRREVRSPLAFTTALVATSHVLNDLYTIIMITFDIVLANPCGFTNNHCSVIAQCLDIETNLLKPSKAP